MVVTKMRLYQYPQNTGNGQYEMIPVWICEVYDEENAALYYIPIQAVTGEELFDME
jgi:hypothetical protein